MISHSHRFVFVRMMKTASYAMVRALTPYGLQHGPSRGPELSSGHMRARELHHIHEYGSNWDDYFVFGFVRNPWDLLVSWYHHTLARGADFTDASGNTVVFHGFRDYVLGRGWCEHHWGFSGCWDRLTDNEGHDMTDFIGRFEDLQADWRRVCQKIEICPAALPVINSTSHGPYQDYYQDDTREVVAEAFRTDIERFGYSFSGH